MTYRHATEYYEQFDMHDDPQVAAMLALTQAVIDHRRAVTEHSYEMADAIRSASEGNR